MKEKKKIKILYDSQILCFQRYGGISRYFYELYVFFREINREHTYANLPVKYSYNYYFAPYAKPIENYVRRQRLLVNRFKMIEDIYANFLKGEPYNIIHPTYYYPDYLKYIPGYIRKKTKLIITVYDLICEIFYPDSENLQKRAEIIQKADGIIAISEKTKEDLMRIYPSVPEERIRVIYLGNSMRAPANQILKKFPAKYILMVGNRDKYKNGNIVLKALKKAKKVIDDLQLVCAGGGPLTDVEIRLMEELGVKESVIQMSLTDEELYYAYQGAECFIFPSLYEGFGIPILEAFYCKCPVILSNASCFPEIAQDSALYFDPNNEEELAEKICLLLQTPSLANKLIEKGNERLKMFSWENTVAETYKFYKEIAGIL